MISRKFLAVAPLAAVIGLAMPASAAGSAVGVIAGQVTVTPAIPPVTCTSTSYTFSSVVVVGVFNASAGTVGVSASGGSACENLSGASGTVSGSITPGLLGGSTLSCSLSGGAFVRTGPVVTVTTGLTAGCGGLVAAAVPASLFIPTPNASPLTQTTAAFAGLFTAS